MGLTVGAGALTRAISPLWRELTTSHIECMAKSATFLCMYICIILLF